MARIYHVAKNGNDKNTGTAEQPYLTISKAAMLADEGDTVIVHAGVYRECVSPAHGARTETGRITYMAAEGEKVIIKGSEELHAWEKMENVWQTRVSNAVFGEHNPYATSVDGDWLVKPLPPPHHTGMIYLDGEALDEVVSMKELCEKPMTWFCEVGDKETIFYANFGDADPNGATTEMNMRKSCFYPEKSGLDYITVRGFEMAHAATNWAPPTADQVGLIGPHFAKGWIIENNIIHDARCAAISLGKDGVTGDNIYTRYHRKAGYQTQLEVVFAAKRIGWSRETIGSHIVRNNLIHDCGQNGIVGHLGSAFSEIYGNEIHHIGTMHEYFGYEIAGIKLHAAIDTYIHHNNIHHCTMGSWFDWQAQGVRVSQNVYHHNTKDIWFEVTHGPHLVDNNIFGARMSLLNAAQGGAYVHNIFFGGIYRYDVIERSTPYHYGHSTDIKGTALVYGGDDRIYNNIFLDTLKTESQQYICGTEMYNGYPSSLEEYIERVDKHGKGDVENYMRERQPVYIDGNYYGDGAKAYDKEKNALVSDVASGALITEEENGVYLTITLAEGFENIATKTVTTKTLGMPRLTEEPYEHADGTPIAITTDFFGNARGERPTAGPIEGLKAGTQKILLLKK